MWRKCAVKFVAASSALRFGSGVKLSYQDCAVCLQKRNHPTQLPCGHIFCFLCVKGIAIQSRKCAMCRAEIPPDYLDNPILLDEVVSDSIDGSGDYQWYYEGRDGWWKYDERSNIDIEKAYSDGKTDCSLLIAGVVYIIDLQNMVQQRHNDHTRKRRIRRDTNALPAKGVAGIKIIKSEDPEQVKHVTDTNSNNRDDMVQDDVIEILDDSTASNNGSSENVQNISDSVVHGMNSITFEELNPPEEAHREDATGNLSHSS